MAIFSAPPRSDHQHETRARRPSGQDRRDRARRATGGAFFRQGAPGGAGALHDRHVLVGAHLCPIRRTGLGALGARPPFPVLHRRGISPTRIAARALRHEPLAQAHRRPPGHSFAQKPEDCPRHRRLEEERPGPRHHRYHGTAKERRLPYRCQAPRGGDPPAWQTGQET